MSTQTDVLIIGAGSAGLPAAKELTKQGISFIVVEASHRIGGGSIKIHSAGKKCSQSHQKFQSRVCLDG